MFRIQSLVVCGLLAAGARAADIKDDFKKVGKDFKKLGQTIGQEAKKTGKAIGQEAKKAGQTKIGRAHV